MLIQIVSNVLPVVNVCMAIASASVVSLSLAIIWE